MTANLNRRNFIKLGLGAAAGMTFIPLLNSCATLIETKEDVANIQWDANPIIPVPKKGCYIGWHFENRTRNLGTDGDRAEERILDMYIENYGKGVAAHSFSDRRIQDYRFPTPACEAMAKRNVYPIIRYHPYSPGFNNIANGEKDQDLVRFAKTARKYGKPFFFIPFPEANIGGAWKKVHSWAGGSSRKFRKAWVHIYNIFDNEGCNDFVVWGLHLLGAGDRQSYNGFALEDQYVDWVGFTIYNLEKQEGRDLSFRNRFSGGGGYNWARNRYPSKPIALWELGTSSTSRQGRWIKNAYRTIERHPRIKLVVYAEYHFGPISRPTDSTFIKREARPAYKEATSSDYFIGSNS